MPQATRSTVPNRLVSTGMVLPATFSNSTAGPRSASSLVWISVISSRGETSAPTRTRRPAFSSRSMKSRRDWYAMA